MKYIMRPYYEESVSIENMKSFFSAFQKVSLGYTSVFSIEYLSGQVIYTIECRDDVKLSFESLFYSYFGDSKLEVYTERVSTQGVSKKFFLGLKNGWLYPFSPDPKKSEEFILQLFRSFEQFQNSHLHASLSIKIRPLQSSGVGFYIISTLKYIWFRLSSCMQGWKYLFNRKVPSSWRRQGKAYFREKLSQEIARGYIELELHGESHEDLTRTGAQIFECFKSFKNYPYNEFVLLRGAKKLLLSSEELASMYNFPFKIQSESSLYKLTSKKLSPPIGVHSPSRHSSNTSILGKSDYRSVDFDIGIENQDRLKHLYVVGKTGTGKSKFLSSLMIQDLQKGNGLGVLDPHGDLIEDIMMHIPPERIEDVIIFDPSDEEYPFCFNPLDLHESESKQVLAKGFIDIFKKFFGANWNARLEHVLRMVILALLDKKGSTLFDIIRALTDKDFRYEMIAEIQDDVVKNFWTQEFAAWSQQFNNDAIMPVLNKVGQILSIDALRNIFSNHENKLDMRKIMDEGKILLVKLPKGKLQEEIMGFLGAMFVTKIYQAAMSRQSLRKEERKNFYLYIDEFQNFATDTFSEILSESRKYGLSLCIAHQFLKQIPTKLLDAVFGNIGTLACFRVASDDALVLQKQFDSYMSSYDLANLNQREFYAKVLVGGQVKDPFSVKSLFVPDINFDSLYLEKLYDISRKKYTKSRKELEENIIEEDKDVLEKIVYFAEPIL